ncbi:MAG: kinetochore-associated Ndc80 complex subunit spc25 [Phylliscum demangeonii]|nr:MAG: kinetochore-associated Ndc80 complex subunit spc25 [Phylliscum demangeonii]
MASEVSSTRPPSTSGHAPSMADSLPSVDFGFDELRDRMARFTVKFDDFIERGRKRVLEERNQFRMNVAELHEDQRMKKKDIEILKLQSATQAHALEKEQQEEAEMSAAIAAIKLQQDSRAAHRDRLRAQVEETQTMIGQRLEAQRRHAQQLEAQARFNRPELEFWQDYLCLRIEGAGVEDRLKFVYTHVDERAWEREAWFELGMGKRDYELLHCHPKLEPDAMRRVLEQLNDSRDLAVFLKRMRELFIATLKAAS